MPEPSAREATYSLGAVSRLTGLSGHVLRAWERRYGAIRPLRTEGGTRRYRESDVARLHLLRGAVEAGHAISGVARLSDEELRRRVGDAPGATALPLRALLDAAARLDSAETERLLGLQLAALGVRRFATQVAAPLLREIGDAWQAGRLDVATEHLVSAQLRDLLGSALRNRPSAPSAPTLLFTTPSGERHELGVLIGAVCAAEAGAQVTFLGADLPADEIARAAERCGARVVVVGLVQADTERFIEILRDSLPADCRLWVGGPGSGSVPLPEGVEAVADVAELERKVALLVL